MTSDQHLIYLQMSGGVSSALRMAGTLGKHSSLHAMATADVEVSNEDLCFHVHSYLPVHTAMEKEVSNEWVLHRS